ncbi:MAG: energy transducer TonB [Rhodothermales bacterium]
MARSKNYRSSEAQGTNASPLPVLALLLGSYQTRIMLTLAASLLIVTTVLHLPFNVPLYRIGWGQIGATDQPRLEVVDINTKSTEREPSGAIITTFGINDEIVEEDDGDDALQGDADDNEAEPLPSPATLPPIKKLEIRQAVLDYADEQPDIQGGLGAYYIHIEYPQKAIDKGIEGRLVLSFIVEPDGTPSNIRVLKPLHPLCDSSAVGALRKTRFIPGRQNGETVRVRMQLPVRFTIIDQGTSSDSTNAKSVSSGL